MSIKKLNDCKECIHYNGMQSIFVKCTIHKDITVMVPSAPSNWNKGFKNGEIVVNCLR